MAATVDTELLDPEFMNKLDQLALVSKRILAGKMRGERITKRRGESVEFADYRNYVVGDDLRFLDWNVYARLDQLFIKLFLQEEDLHVSVLIDVSKSMDWGTPHKGLYAARVAAAVAYIGLVNFDRVSIYTYADGLQGELAGVRGRRLMFRVAEFLTNLTYESAGRLSSTGKQFAVRHPQPGIVLVISDFLEKEGYEEGLKFLLSRKYDLYALQVLSAEEINPRFVGDLSLTDVEDGDIAEVTAGRAVIDRYKRTVKAYCSQFRDYCTRRGISYMFTSTEIPFDRIVLSYFRKRGLLK